MTQRLPWKRKTYKEDVYTTGNLTQKFTWSSADQTIATVDQNGLIKGIAEGQTTVSYTSEDGVYKKDLIVIVTEKDPESREELQEEDVILKQSKLTYTGKQSNRKLQSFTIMWNLQRGRITVFIITIM